MDRKIVDQDGRLGASHLDRQRSHPCRAVAPMLRIVSVVRGHRNRTILADLVAGLINIRCRGPHCKAHFMAARAAMVDTHCRIRSLGKPLNTGDFISSPHRQGGPSVQPGSRKRSNTDMAMPSGTLEQYSKCCNAQERSFAFR